ncbi:MAG: hypothetical protein LKJ22_08460 [Liquorilactobacillus nagelii]|jgi:hypothetical protein|uniref:hypothetical protein n=1 Tax=Liquorilactobacillus nagelii TaxID=82688 RepID=UPI002431C2BB|nr:hypothetical protein [Liquorilactobacillus nagelii]MCI1921938.1 hypothetical protein [Liquorilactobacillus nagelii]MCI1976414.1 hypothetical protein [Liquorilactobacillus nagelii]
MSKRTSGIVNLDICLPKGKQSEYQKLNEAYMFHKKQATLLKNKIARFEEENLKITQI